MKTLKYALVFVLIIALLAPAGAAWADPDGGGKGGGGGGGKGGKPGGETAGNNLSFPVIWAEGVTKTLPTPLPDEPNPKLEGNFYYWWGTEGSDPNIVPLSCMADPDDQRRCDDKVDDVATGPLPPTIIEEPDLVKAYIQKDQDNVWQAWSGTPAEAGVAESDGTIAIDWIDWGDNLESVDWYTRSQVRTEVVLFQDLPEQKLEFDMRHVDGWGIDEVHGLSTDLYDNVTIPTEPLFGMRATVYSRCARFTIQRLYVEREKLDPTCLEWKEEDGWTESGAEGCPAEDLINDLPLFNEVVYEAGDGPGYYNAEINVKGRIIYGYTWNVRRENEGAGDYRLTFSFDEENCPDGLSTFFREGVTQIMVPLEEETEAIAAEIGEEPGGGATGVLRTDLNLTYIDVRILERGGGGGGHAAAASFMPELPFEPAEVISVDVKPQACPNVINIDLPGPEGNGHGPGGPGNGNGGEGGGHVRVAALGSESFDVAEIQAGSVRLLVPAGDDFVELTPEAGHTVVEDVATVYPETFTDPLSGYECLAAGGDGYDDMNFMFEATELAEALAGMEEETATLVYLTGMLEGDLSFAGADVILINEGGAPDDPGNTSVEQIFVPMARNFGQ